MITDNELQEVSQVCGIECFKTSAVSGYDVERSFLTVIQLAYNHKLKNSQQDQSLTLKDRKEKKGCCS